MPKTVPGNLRLEHVAPEIHISREKVGPQVFKKFYAANDQKHQVESERGDRRGRSALKQHRKKHGDGGDYQQCPGAGDARISKTLQRFVAQQLAGLVNQIERARIKLQITPAYEAQSHQKVQTNKESDQQ